MLNSVKNECDILNEQYNELEKINNKYKKEINFLIFQVDFVFYEFYIILISDLKVYFLFFYFLLIMIIALNYFSL